MRVLLASIAATALLGTASANAAVLYSQAWDGSPNGYSSQDDPIQYGAFATVYDNFTLASGGSISSVDFTGLYFNGAPAPPSSFKVSFYSNSGGAPGALLGSTTVAGAPGETALGNQVYSYNMATSFLAAAGQTYWLSVVPTLGFPPQWGWSSGTGGDGAAVQDFFGSRGPLAVDLAFTLNGTAVPEPESWLLMIAGFGAMGTVMRRRRVHATV